VYGENNLKAPPPINGLYRLTLSENLPNCEKSDTLTLKIQQSGIYLNASVLSAPRACARAARGSQGPARRPSHRHP
ncbi:hypothetical protein FM036_43120, partial [Nostoc sp. HG1]|nr:hypothetical protein [Nostoc sp. HG1]